MSRRRADRARRKYALLYDADCGFCRWSCAWVLRWDRRHALRPVALQDPEADRLLPAMGDDERMSSWHLVGPDGSAASAGAALPALLRLLPGGRPAAAAAAKLPRATERAYRFVSRHRGAIGRLLTSGARARAEQTISGRRPASG